MKSKDDLIEIIQKLCHNINKMSDTYSANEFAKDILKILKKEKNGNV